MLEQQCSGNMQHRRENTQELLASTQAALDKQAAAWSAACTAMGQLLTQLSVAHDKHKDGHANLQTGIRRSLERTLQVTFISNTGLCGYNAVYVCDLKICRHTGLQIG